MGPTPAGGGEEPCCSAPPVVGERAASVEGGGVERYWCAVSQTPRVMISASAARPVGTAERADRPDDPAASVRVGGEVDFGAGVDEAALALLDDSCPGPSEGRCIGDAVPSAREVGTT